MMGIADEVNIAGNVEAVNAWVQAMSDFGISTEAVTAAFTDLVRWFTEDVEAMAVINGALCSVDDETHGMTLDELLGDDVAELIRANRLK